MINGNTPKHDRLMDKQLRLAKIFGGLLILLAVFTYGFGWLFDSTTPILGVPMLIFMIVFVITPVAIIAMIIYQFKQNKLAREMEMLQDG